MLYLTLPPSLLLAVLAIVAARPAPHAVRWGPFILLCGVVCVGVPTCAGILPTATAFALVALTIALGAWVRLRYRMRSFLPLAFAAVLVAYLVGGLFALRETAEHERLRASYPYESMADRVPTPGPASRTAALAQSDGVDERVEAEAQLHLMREYFLEQLHERTTEQFVNSPGFGVARMIPLTEDELKPRPRNEPPPQPRRRPVGSAAFEWDDVADAALRDLHTAGVVDFVDPAGFGLVKSRERVAGFRPHAFSKVPGPAKDWHVESVELVGLLLHAEPVVYVSARLPAMADVRDTPTRRPDAFEERGLSALRAGEPLSTARDGDRLRMLGPLRNGRRCVGCHGGEPGDLLGAFTYTLGPTAPPTGSSR